MISVVRKTLQSDESDLKSITSLLVENYRKRYELMIMMKGRTHGRALTEEMKKRLNYPHIATFPNTFDMEGNVMILQRVVKVL